MPGLAARMAALMDLDIEVEEMPSKEHLDEVEPVWEKLSIITNIITLSITGYGGQMEV